jgi:DNA-binding transcriptional ArsR family regulator
MELSRAAVSLDQALHGCLPVADRRQHLAEAELGHDPLVRHLELLQQVEGVREVACRLIGVAVEQGALAQTRVQGRAVSPMEIVQEERTGLDSVAGYLYFVVNHLIDQPGGWINHKNQPDAALDRAFMALADPVRRAIVARLSRGDATVNELAEPFAITKQAVSKHIQVLEQAGLVTRSRDAQRRPVHLDAAALERLTAWIDRYRLRAEERFRRLDALLDTMTDTTTHKGADT